MRAVGLGLLLLAGCAVDEDEAGPPEDTGASDDSAVDSADTAVDTDTGPEDRDGDGVLPPVDCNDSDSDTFPGAVERCDGRDNDCDGHLADGEALVEGEPACAACDAAGYWPVLRDLGDTDDVVAALAEVVSGLDCDYDDARDDLFGPVDGVVVTGGHQAEGVYTGTVVTYAGAQPDASVMNTEHTWPQSRGADREPLRCDLNHLFPADAVVNSRRGNLPFGEVIVASWSDEAGNREGGGLFEPRDAAKGRIARALLYVELFYGSRLSPDDRLSAYELDIAKAWHGAYGLDDAERARALRILDAQGVANPLVVCDGLDARLGWVP